jgi:hypothetical protein
MIRTAGQCILTKLPLQTHMSHPIPLRGSRGPLAGFLYCRANIVYGEGIYLLPPSHMGFVNCEDAKLIELRPVQPADFGRNDAPDQILGLHKARTGETEEEFRANKALLYECYDLLFPLFAINHVELSQEAKYSVQVFKRLFGEAMEEVLLPYYHAAGQDFFDWLGKAL